MGAIKVQEFSTIDGVVGAPTWRFGYAFPRDLAAAIGALTASSAGILLGRTTSETFAAAWSAPTPQDAPATAFFDGTPKHVVSSTLPTRRPSGPAPR